MVHDTFKCQSSFRCEIEHCAQPCHSDIFPPVNQNRPIAIIMSAFCEDEASDFFAAHGMSVSADTNIRYIDWLTGNNANAIFSMCLF